MQPQPSFCRSFIFMKFLFFTFLFFSAAFVSRASEKMVFDIFLFGNKIGNMSITREIKGDGSEAYLLETKSKAKFLWINRDNQTRYEVVYKDDKLISSLFREVENDET